MDCDTDRCSSLFAAVWSLPTVIGLSLTAVAKRTEVPFKVDLAAGVARRDGRLHK